MKWLGYAIAIFAGWYIWQWFFAVGNTIQRDDGPFILQLLFTWFSLPLGMAAAGLIAWIWFKIVPDPNGRPALSSARTAGTLAALAALTSRGVFAASTGGDPPYALFFPLFEQFGAR